MRRRATFVALAAALSVLATSACAPVVVTAAPVTAPRADPAVLRPGADQRLSGAVDRTAAGLLWNGDAEPGDLSQFNSESGQDVGGTPPRVVTSPVRDGRFAIEVTVNGSTDSSDGICCGTRNELLPRFRDLEEGDDLWFGFSTYLAPGFALQPDWQLITQFKQNFDGSPPLGLYVEQGQYLVEGGYGYPSGPQPYRISLAPVTTGVWVDWVWHVKFSTDPGVGHVEVWKDGALVLPAYEPAFGTLYPGTGDEAGVYVKTGIYRDPSVTTPATMYIDNWRIGTSAGAVAR